MSKNKQKQTSGEELLTTEELLEENREMLEDLTNKNSDYFFKLNRALRERGMPEEERIPQLNVMMKTILEEQHTGVTARQLYGTVSDQATFIIEGPIEEEEEVEEVELSEDWKLYLDGSLLIGGIFALITGLSYFFIDNEEIMGAGIITIIMNFILGGFVMLTITKVAPRPGADNSYLKYFAVSLLAIFLWVVIMAGINIYIPRAINIEVPGVIVLAIGIIALVLKWYLKKRLDIKGGVF